MESQRSLRPLILVVIVVVVVVALAISGLATGLAVPSPVTGSVFSVRQVQTGLVLRPKAWVGRTVWIRGIVLTWNLANRWNPLISANWFQTRSQLFQVVPPSRYQFDAPGMEPVLLVRGDVSRALDSRSRLAILGQAIVDWLSLVPGVNRIVSPPSLRLEQDRMYRVRLLPTGPCPPVLVGACPTGIVVP